MDGTAHFLAPYTAHHLPLRGVLRGGIAVGDIKTAFGEEKNDAKSHETVENPRDKL